MKAFPLSLIVLAWAAFGQPTQACPVAAVRYAPAVRLMTYAAPSCGVEPSFAPQADIGCPEAVQPSFAPAAFGYNAVGGYGLGVRAFSAYGVGNRVVNSNIERLTRFITGESHNIALLDPLAHSEGEVDHYIGIFF